MNIILKELNDRKMLSNISNEVKFNNCIKENKYMYIGFDPSFKSLHLGNYAMIRVLQIFQKHGAGIMPLVGGATGKIGDPSGKKEERKLLDDKIIENNIIQIKKQLLKFTNVERIINNFDFYKDMNFLTFLRNIGKDFNVSYLIAKDIVKSRLEEGISFTEFSYTLIQGYDWYLLNKDYNVGIQCGGSDQWGNITTGLEYIRKRNGFETNIAGITINLLTKSDGTKFGKSEKGAIYLDKDITSVYEMYQFIFNQKDDDIENLLNFLSTYEIEEIKNIMTNHELNKSERYAQKKLCENIILKVHGEKEYLEVIKLTKLLFDEKYDSLTISNIKNAFSTTPIYKIEKLPYKLIDIIIETKIASSKRVAREFFNNNALKVNGNIVSDTEKELNKSDLIANKYLIIKKGKKNFFLLEV